MFVKGNTGKQKGSSQDFWIQPDPPEMRDVINYCQSFRSLQVLLSNTISPCYLSRLMFGIQPIYQ